MELACRRQRLNRPQRALDGTMAVNAAVRLRRSACWCEARGVVLAIRRGCSLGSALSFVAVGVEALERLEFAAGSPSCPQAALLRVGGVFDAERRGWNANLTVTVGRL